MRQISNLAGTKKLSAKSQKDIKGGKVTARCYSGACRVVADCPAPSGDTWYTCKNRCCLPT